MGYFSDGFFRGFLTSVKETGRKFKNGASELVEDFISGFNGHGWKLWKRGDSWRLELDELLVRKSFQVFELIINQITAIKGSQAITQGHAKIKEVTIVESADVYKEVATDPNFYYNSTDWRNPYQTADKQEVVATKDTISTMGAVTEAQAWVVRKGVKMPAKTVQVTVKSTVAMMRYTYSDSAGVNRIIGITESGTYDLPESTGKLADNGFFFDTGFDGEIKQTLLPIETTEEIVQEPCYRIQIDDELNSIVEYDLIRCQKGDKFYYVQVGSVFQYYINIPTSEFEANEEGVVLNAPASGDEIVQFGNASHQDKYANRHSAIYLHVDEDEPAIDLMTDVYSKDWSEGNILKTRIGGNLPGTEGDRGFYCVNGKLLFVDENGDTVSVINPDGSASFARGKLSWSKDGSPVFSGTILLKIDSNNVWEITDDYTNIIGDKNGERIEISTSKRNISFFDKNNKNTLTLDAVSRNSIDELFNIKNIEIDVCKLPIGVGKGVQFSDVTNKFKVENTTTFRFKMGGGSTQGSSLDVIYVRLYLNIYKSITDEAPTMRTILWEDSFNKNTDVNLEKEFTISDSDRYYSISLYGISDRGFNIFTIMTFTIEAVIGGYISSFFSNGIGLGTSNKNTFFFANSLIDGENIINGLISNNLYGIRIEKDNIYTKRGGFWGLMPSIICIGRAHTSNTNAYIDFCKTFDGQIPTISRHGVGQCTMFFPNSWLDDDININTCTILLTGVGVKHGDTNVLSKNVIYPSILFFENSQNFSVILKSDNALSDGAFYFEIKRFT